MNWIIIAIRFLLKICKFESHLTTCCIRFSSPFTGKNFISTYKPEFLTHFQKTIRICRQNHTKHTVLITNVYFFKKTKYTANKFWVFFVSFFIIINCMERSVSNSLPFRILIWKTKASISCIYLCIQEIATKADRVWKHM